MTLHILASGGTFDKHYDPLSGKLGFGESHLPAALARARLTVETTLELLPPLDSLDMQPADRQRILDACRRSTHSAVVILHGTDTMPETAAVLGAAHLPRTIVLTGAMIPYEIDGSDALFNLGFACGVAQTLPAGVYIAMNGRIFDWDKVVKNRGEGIFESAAAAK
ncbi:asparaginase domain-containing protein [Herbaspirillum sp. RTI4]|uniref:asparaginase domain-containing protein n=1 Tax=Herbaspirillum sp. RTI4 TaxID=3048640 RepID=UPI002AB5B369|nr:asparaginase domain-containing protein [Herbaspirillum sp. RTI4]MDY7576952.1 asparaginase domain-containing protein [Herbaspirillum sp. RTI4]MEA9982146.1 asparaginase domain-containing protein [Herbaspirillum sp. RTI4]